MSAYLREQRRELYSKSGELQGEEGDRGMHIKSCGGSDYSIIHGRIWLVVHFLVEKPMIRLLRGRDVLNW